MIRLKNKTNKTDHIKYNIVQNKTASFNKKGKLHLTSLLLLHGGTASPLTVIKCFKELGLIRESTIHVHEAELGPSH